MKKLNAKKKVSVEKQYDKVGKDYLSGQQNFFSKREDQAIRFIVSSLPNLKGKNILDFGCGNGKDIKRYEKMGAKNIYGIDVSQLMVLEAKKNVKEPENIFLSDIQKTKFKNNYFDVVIGRFSLHYLDRFDSAYKEISRILKKNGCLIFVAHHPFKDLIMQRVKEYGKKEVIKVELYSNKVSIYFPTHTLKNYFSKTFFRYFCVDNFEEEQSPEEYPDKFRLPGFIGVKAIKK
jgi:ubiquinone/menaquinone biosynthesis C-methylase UbiE